MTRDFADPGSFYFGCNLAVSRRSAHRNMLVNRSFSAALFRAVACALFAMVCASGVFATAVANGSWTTTHDDVLDPALREAIASADDREKIAAYLVMADQLSGGELERRARASSAGLIDGPGKATSPASVARTRRRLVAEMLKAHAQSTQRPLRSVLAAAQKSGQAELIDVLWMGNALFFRAEPAVLQRLSEMPGVNRICLMPETPASRAQDAQPTPPSSPGVGTYPFLDNFESGALLPHWTVAASGDGYAAVTDLHDPAGDWHVVMGTNTNSVDSVASLTVELDLVGEKDVGIRFRHKEFGDEDHPEDGVFVSADGLAWHKVYSLEDASAEYSWEWVSLDSMLSGFGISYTNNFLVRFQWRDNFNIPSDGFAFDDIEIAPGVGIQPPPDIEPHIVALQAPSLWDKGFEGSGILIGNIDSGADWQHPDLIERVWTNPGEIPGNNIDDDANGFIDDLHGWDFKSNSSNVSSTDPHGTQAAGLMVGDGTQGRITGMAPAASMAICEVSNEAHYWQAQQYLLSIGVDVVSSSYSYKWPDRPDYHMFRQLCDVELAAGIIHANSIGNQGVLTSTHPTPFNISTPGNCPSPFAHPDLASGGRSSVMACGGIQLPDDSLYNPSGRGPSAWEDISSFDASFPHAQLPEYWDYEVGGFGGGLPGLIKPDVVTYTNSVMTTNLNGGYSLFSGTSAATPQLAGAMALLLDVQPAAQPRHIAAALELSAVDLGDPGKDNLFGSGKIQVFDAARRLKVLARFSPQVASPGEAFALEVFGAPNDIVYGFFQSSLVTNTGELNLPLPLFFLGMRLLDSEGAASWNLSVPQDPALIGLTVWFQAASEAQDGSWGGGPFLSVPDSLTVTP
jgi:subtilisin family serine protease